MVSMLQHILADARGYSQHLFFGHNDFRQVWTGDRCETHTVVAPLFFTETDHDELGQDRLGTHEKISHTLSKTNTAIVFLFNFAGRFSPSIRSSAPTPALVGFLP